MSVENTPPHATNRYGAETAAGQRNTEPPNLETLKNAFAEAMRSSLNGRRSGNDSTNNLLFDATDASRQSSDRRKEHQQEDRRQTALERQDRSFADRSEVDQSQMRASQLQDEYDAVVDRRDRSRSEYAQRTERPESNRPVPTAETVSLGMPPSMNTIAALNGAPPTGSPTVAGPGAGNVIGNGVVGVTPGTAALEAASGNGTAPAFGADVMASNLAIPFSTAPLPIPSSGAISGGLLATASVLTVFTATGRFEPDKAEEEEKNDSIGKKKGKKEKNLSSFILKALTPLSDDDPIKSATLPENRAEEAADKADKKTARIFPEFQVAGNPAERPTGREDGEKRSDREENEVSALENGSAATFSRELQNAPGGIPSELAPDSSSERFREHFKEIAWQPIDGAVPPPPDQATTSEPVSESTISVRIEQARFVQRVAAACRSAANRSGTVRFKLNLDDLGSLTIRVDTRERNRLAIRFETTTEAARLLLRENMETLKSVLAERRIVLEQVEIESI